MKFPIFLVFISILSSCGNYTELSELEEFSFDARAVANLSFTQVRDQIFAPKCLSCHSQYGEYDAVKSNLNAIMTSIETNRMPKNAAPLTQSEKELMRAWVKLGAPNSPNAPAPVPMPLEANWESLNNKIFAAKCTICHNPQGQARFLDLSTRQAFFEQRDRDFGGEILVDFENPNASYLITVIADPDEPMPPSWSGLTPLTTEEIEVIKTWIERGLP